MLKKLRYQIEYLALMLFSGLIRSLPRRAALALGRALGGLIRCAQPRRRKKAAENLRHAFPEMSEQERERLLRENFRQLGITGVEMMCLDRYHNQRVIDDCFEFHGMEHLQSAFALGRGTFLLTGHVGFWEAGTMILPMLGYPTDFVYKRVKNPYVEEQFLTLRQRAGARCIEKKRAARKIVRSLGENRGVAILLDQRLSRHEAVQVNFLGRPVNATPIIAQMAIKLGTPIVPIFSRRLADNRYEITVEPMILLAHEDNPSMESVVQATQLLTDRIEAAVRRAPEQWFWVHDRWRL